MEYFATVAYDSAVIRIRTADNYCILSEICSPSQRIGPIAFSIDATKLGVCCDKDAMVYEIGTNDVLLAASHPTELTAVSFHTNCEQVLFAERRVVVTVYDISTKDVLFEVKGHGDYAFPMVCYNWDSSVICMVGSNPFCMTLVYPNSGKELGTIAHSEPNCASYSLCTNPVDNAIAVGGFRKTTQFDLSSMDYRTVTCSFTEGIGISLAYNSTGNRLATGFSDGQLVVRDSTSLEIIWRLNSVKSIMSLSFKGDSETLCIGQDFSLNLYNSRRSRVTGKLSQEGRGIFSNIIAAIL